MTKKKSYLVAILTVVVFFAINVVYFEYFRDPFAAYKPWFSSELSISPVQLKFNQNAEKLVRERLAHPISSKEASILAGIHWVLHFVDDDSIFDNIFSEFIILMHELSRSDLRRHQSETAHVVLIQSLARAEHKLSSLFPADDEGRWDFIAILPIVADHPEYHSSYYGFYTQQYGVQNPPTYTSGDMDFSKAVERADYEVIGDYLIDTSFLHYYLSKAGNSQLILPNDDFLGYLEELESFAYNQDLPVKSDDFAELAYLATHVALVLTNYGEFELTPSSNANKVSDFINATFDPVRFSLGDLDLLAEYLQSLKILENGNDRRVVATERLLLSLQRPNGSWGTNHDFNSKPYMAFHPTWAVLAALNHESTPKN